MQAQPETIERISRAELKEKLQRGENVVIVDARDPSVFHDPSVFQMSNIKPKGSIRIAPGAMNGEIARLLRNKTIVTV